jgi:hypothetical protein
MKTAEQVKSDFLATLWELQNTTPSENLKKHLQTKAKILADILEDDFPDEYGEQLESESNPKKSIER